jgi:hypothetical protein
MIPKKSPAVVSRKIEDEVVLVPVRKKPEEVDSLFVMNDVGSRIWELIDGRRACAEIVNCILEEYDVSRSVAEEALATFLMQLQGIGVLDEVQEVSGGMPSCT